MVLPSSILVAPIIITLNFQYVNTQITTICEEFINFFGFLDEKVGFFRIFSTYTLKRESDY